MDTTIGSMTTQPTVTTAWEWNSDNVCLDEETVEEQSDRVAWLVGEELRKIYDDMRGMLNDAFDVCYPDPTPENQEEYFDAHVGWLDDFEAELSDSMGTVRLAREGDGYLLAVEDDDGEECARRTIRLDTALSDEELCRQISTFLTAHDPLREIKALGDDYLRYKRPA